MKYILNSQEMKECDAKAINEYAIPSIVLMENAASGVANFIKEYYPNKKNICLLAGNGNNGGDGFAIARLLRNTHDVKVFCYGDESKMSPETLINYHSNQKIGIKTYFLEDKKFLQEIAIEADIIIDSLIGIGGDENLRGNIVDILEIINKINAVKIAVDIPTGLNSNTGKIHKNCFRANHTFSMYATKIGMYLNDGPEVCGEIHSIDIGAPSFLVEELAKFRILERCDIKTILPKREKNTSKFDYGRLLIIAGSETMPGAAALATNSAIKIGTGLVELITVNPHSAILPEIIVHKAKMNKNGGISKEFLSAFEDKLVKFDCILIGPGLGNSEDTTKGIQELIEVAKMLNKKLVLDADGFRAVNVENHYSNMLLTPHIGEFALLTKSSRNLLQKNYIAKAIEYAKSKNAILLQKNNPTVITNGDVSYLNTGGNPGMATAGSGDVLAGIIAGLAAQGLSIFEAAYLGAYLHSAAGDNFIKKNNIFSLSASNLINEISKLEY